MNPRIITYFIIHMGSMISLNVEANTVLERNMGNVFMTLR